MPRSTPPSREEAADYYFTYIDQVPPGDIIETLQQQSWDALTLFNGITDEKSLHRYGPGKWSIRESLSHVNDTERVFTFRALWFARDLGHPLPSFDQDVAVAVAGADGREWNSHVDEFAAIRDASVALFEGLPDSAWNGRGIASEMPFTVNALAWITAGHVAHHLRILRERYL